MVDCLAIAVYLVPVDKLAHNHRLVYLPPLGKRACAHHGDDLRSLWRLPGDGRFQWQQFGFRVAGNV